jgi:hypothetical protein
MDNPKPDEKTYTIVERTKAQEEWDKEIGEQCKWDEYISNKLDREDRENRSDDEEI